MATSSSRGPDRSIHQDYIARIRYSNTLPPPPNPPKLLEIPNTGLSSGVYTAPGFASRLAREQPLNIEADAELGMHLDLVGMPGVFDGDESSIQAAIHPPAPHPHDRALLRPLNSIGKPKVVDSGSSFLRRTEYISSTSKPRHDDAPSKPVVKRARPSDRFKPLPRDLDKESPEYILAAVQRSFEVTAANLTNPLRLRHPSKRNVRLLSSHPIIPDLDAFGDAGAYISVKFQNNPLPPSSTYDTRLTAGMLRPLTGTDASRAAHGNALAAHERDPSRHPHPGPEQDYEFFLPDSSSDAAKFKRKCDVHDAAARDDDGLYSFTSEESGQKCFRFKRVRAYETSQETTLHGEGRWNSEVALAVNDGADGVHQCAAYVYPLLLRTTVRTQRSKNIDRLRFGGEAPEEDQEGVDFLDVMVREPDEGEVATRKRWAENPNGDGEEEEEEEEEELVEEQEERAESVGSDGEANGTQNGHVEEDADAESE